jgi:hypothetical protein
VVVGLVGLDVVPFVSLDVVPFVGLDVVPFVGLDVGLVPFVGFKVLVVNEVSVVGPQLQAVVGFRVVCVTGGHLVGLGVTTSNPVMGSIGSIGSIGGRLIGDCVGAIFGCFCAS